METALSLGSNLGDRLAFLSEARRRLEAFGETRSLARSSVYETEPVGVRPAHRDLPFYNAVLVLESPADPSTWLERLGCVEEDLGRVRGEDRCAPRTIDVDILYCGDHCIGSGGLVVPHPRWAERRFVVAPLAEVRPGLVLPGQTRTVSQILDHLPGAEKVQRLDLRW